MKVDFFCIGQWPVTSLPIICKATLRIKLLGIQIAGKQCSPSVIKVKGQT
jgi:hypothetical protein